MVDPVMLMFGICVFVAVVLAVESFFIWWNSTRGPEAKRMERRLREASAGGHGQGQLSILKQRTLSHSPWLEKLLLLIPRVHRLDRTLVQSGLNLSVGDFFGISVILFATGVILVFFLGRSLPLGLLLGGILAALPSVNVLRVRAKRLAAVERQLPDAIDLMGRALRAGHAFPSALQMVGDEMSDPIGAEFRVLFDEINYGVAINDAMLNLLNRVPSNDLRYFVVAILIQRETGGNLAELFDSISAIVRARLKLLGEIRTLSAEGRISAWILTLLPFAVGSVINIINPNFLAEVWNDALGLKLIYGAAALMVFGIWAMTRIIKIRV